MTGQDSKEEKGKWQQFAEKNNEVEETAEERLPDGVAASEGDEIVDDGLDLDVNLDLDEGLVADMRAADELSNQVKSLEMKIASYRDQAVRAAAEVDNMRRRAERDVSNAHRYGNEKLITDLLPVIDSMVRAQEGVDADDAVAQSMLEGVGMTLGLLETTLVKFGLKVISPESGEAFNPECHEAMSMVPSADLPKNSVMQLLQKGYELNGRVLRAAMVIVTQ